MIHNMNIMIVKLYGKNIDIILEPFYPDNNDVCYSQVPRQSDTKLEEVSKVKYLYTSSVLSHPYYYYITRLISLIITFS